MQAIVGGLVAFAVVAGWALFRWWATGRDPSYLDDPSILLPEPPEGMTAATATIVDGGGAPTAFMAALFDLASRDEIAFRDETPDRSGAHRVGIEIRGGHSDDARVALNHRRPVGEGEAWLLANLRSYASFSATGLHDDDRGMAEVAAVSAFSGFIANALAAGAGDGDGLGPTAGDAMLGPGAPDLQTAVMAALERSGKPVPGGLRSSIAGRAPIMELMREAMADPTAVTADPKAFAGRIEAVTGHAPTQEEMDSLVAWLREHEPDHGRSDDGSPAAPGSATYISADHAARFHPPLGFATFVESYARRRGWITGLSFISRWKWEGLGAVELVVGLLVASAGAANQQLVYGVGLGIAAGGLATWLVARYMASRTREGAVMKAQLAAYRRTLKATFDTSATLDGVASQARLTWLETPDQVLVWGVALGLRREIEALLERTSSGISAGTVPRSAFLPRWIGRPTRAVSAAVSETAVATSQSGAGNVPVGDPAQASAPPTPSEPPPASAGADAEPAAAHDYAAVFAGIERIGTVAASGAPRH